MTKSLWRDPIFDDMDPISQRVLPYLSSAENDRLCETIDPVLPVSVVKSFLQHNSYHGYNLTSLFKERLGSTVANKINVEIPDLPDEIVIDIVNDTINIEDLHVKVSVVTNPETITDTILGLFRNIPSRECSLLPGDEIRFRKYLKSINAIFTDNKISSRRLVLVRYELLGQATRWLAKLDIRNADFPHRFKKEVLSAIDGDAASILWLKVLKARSLNNEPIYSMELA